MSRGADSDGLFESDHGAKAYSKGFAKSRSDWNSIGRSGRTLRTRGVSTGPSQAGAAKATSEVETCLVREMSSWLYTNIIRRWEIVPVCGWISMKTRLVPHHAV